MKLNRYVLIGMEHFIQMIMMTNLAIHTIVVPLQTGVPNLTKFLTKSYRVIYKRKKIENFQGKVRTKILTFRNMMKLLKKERVT